MLSPPPFLTDFLAPQRLRATQFLKQMRSGRTQPWMVVAQTEDGNEYDVVVKLQGSPQLAPHGLAAELIAALLGRDLGVPVRPPLLVSVDAPFVKALPERALGHIGQRSIGWNFGTEKWEPGFTMWTSGLAVSEDMRRTLCEILAFDCIIQNPDRTRTNPNCVFRGEVVIAFDHDLAFSNILSVAADSPWEPGALGFLGDHAFRSEVAGHFFDPERLREALQSVNRSRIEDYLRCVPESWTRNREIRNRMAEYLHECVAKFDVISQNLEALL